METVFRAYQVRIHRHVRSMVRDPEMARDLTQETFLRAHRELASLRDTDAIAVWLYRIATRVCVDAYRRASGDMRPAPAGPQQGPDTEEESLTDPEAPSLQLLVEQAQMGGCVRAFIDDLPESYRAVLLLYELEGMTGPELARHLDCSLATVKIRLHRARRRLEEALRAGCSLSSDERGVVVCEPKRSAR